MGEETALDEKQKFTLFHSYHISDINLIQPDYIPIAMLTSLFKKEKLYKNIF